MIALTRRALLFAAGGATLMQVAARAQTPSVTFGRSELVIESSGRQHHFNIEVADTDDRRELGLMYRTSLPADGGMLFDFKHDDEVAMWMHNTRIPLDMLFIDRTGRIVNIAQRAVPLSDATIPSAGPVRAVLELNGGTAERLGIKAGDQVIQAMFNPAG